MIRVLHYGLSPNRGGIENYLYKIWSHIDHTKFQFDFVDEWKGNACYRREFEAMGAHFFNITQRRDSVIKNKAEWNRVLIEHRPDIVHCHLNTMSYDTPLKTALSLSIPVIIHSRSAGAVKTFHTLIMHAIHKRKYSVKQFERLAVSKKAGIWLFGKQARFEIINNGVEIEKYKFCDEHRIRIRKEFGIGLQTLLIGNVGALVRAKNQEFLLRVFADIKRKNQDTALLIAGEGCLRDKLEHRCRELGVNDCVFMPGNREDIPALLSAMDIYVMPSVFEGFPNAVLEAQTSGLKCLLSDTITREVDAGLCQYLSLNEPVRNWGEEILCASRETNRRTAFESVEKAGFSVQKEIGHIESIYNDIYEGRKGYE